jgi:hypothetical protein
MAMLAISNGGAGPLARAKAVPFLRGGIQPVGTVIKCTSGGAIKVTTGSRLRIANLMVPDSTSSRSYQAGSKCRSGIWSEWSYAVALACANYTAGSAVSTIGSGLDEDIEIEEPAATFPDLSFGTGIIRAYRTLVSGGFVGNSRRPKWAGGRSAFKIVMRLLDSEQSQLLHRWFRALNGAMRPFWFDFEDPNTGDEKRYLVRFRDGSIGDQINVVGYSDLQFNLVEEPTATLGGDV